MSRAQVLIKEWDQSTRVPSFPGVYIGIIANFEKGKLDGPQLITSETQMLKYLTNDETVKVGTTSAYYSMYAALQKSNTIWAVRVAKNARYGACYLMPDKRFTDIIVTANSSVDTLSFVKATATELEKATSLYNNLSTGDRVTFSISSGGTLPAPLSISTSYYIIKYDDTNLKIRIATSLVNAQNGVFIDLTTDGTGTITLNVPVNGSNGESEFAISNPDSYALNSSDGKPAGFETTFSVDVTNDAFNTTKAFFESCDTGDTITLTADTFPTVDSGSPLDGVTTYYVIKIAQTIDTTSYKIQLARTLSDANAGTYIGLLTVGDDVNGTLTGKLNTGSVTVDYLDDLFTIPANLYAMSDTGDIVRFTTTGTYPTVDSGDVIDSSTNYYIIKTSTANKVQISRTIGGNPITFSANGTGTQTFTLTGKTNISTLVGDISNDILTVSNTFYESVNTTYSCRVSTTGTLPKGLSSEVIYYVIKSTTTNKIRLASTSVNAQLGIAVDITDAGTGVHTLLDTHNTELIGLDQKLMLIYTYTACAEQLYIQTLHYPYGDSSTWTDAQKTAANTVKEPNCFKLYVYKKDTDGNYYQVEEHLLSRVKGYKDGNNTNCYVEDAIEASNYIRILDNTTLDSDIYPIDQSDYIKLTNGSGGDTVTDDIMLQGCDYLASRRDIFVTLLMDGGYSVPSFQKQGLIQLCENRKDCFAILTCPIATEQSSDYMTQVLDYRRNQLNASTSYAALFSPHVYIQDKWNDRKLYAPVDGYVAAAISETASNYEMWYAPAGNRRGQLNVLDLVRRYSEGEQSTLYDAGINPIDFYPGKGIKIWGQKTLLSRPSALDRINVRLLLIVIEPAIAEFLEDFVFEFNDDITRIQAKSGIDSYMNNIKARRGVYDFLCKCDLENNTQEDIDANKMNVDLFVKPVRVAEFINFTTIITRTGASFSF